VIGSPFPYKTVNVIVCGEAEAEQLRQEPRNFSWPMKESPQAETALEIDQSAGYRAAPPCWGAQCRECLFRLSARVPKKPLMPSATKAFPQTNVGVGIFATNARYFQQLSSVRRHMSSHPQPFRIYFQSLPQIQGYMYQQYIRHNVTPHKELLDAVTLGLPGLTSLLG
jgi:hypothetical protein